MNLKQFFSTVRDLYGFGDTAASWKLWAFTLFFVAVSSAILYQSYDRYKLRKKVYSLTVDNLQLRTEKEIMKSQHRVDRLLWDMKNLDKRRAGYEKARTALRTKIEASRKKIKDSKKRLIKDIRDLKDRSVDELLNQNRDLTKSVKKKSVKRIPGTKESKK